MKPKPDRAYLGWLAAQGCLVCGSPAQIHHVRQYGSARDDHRTLALCPAHHQIEHGPRTAIHALGKRKFEQLHGVDIESSITDYRERYAARSR